MNDVREICDLMLEEPEPPLRESGEVLAVARRVTQRRTRLRTGSALTAVAASAAAVAVTAVTAMSGPAAPLQFATPAIETAPVITEETPTVPPPKVPTQDAAQAHGPRIVELLRAGTPAGLTAQPRYPDQPTNTLNMIQGSGSNPITITWDSGTMMALSAGGREGDLSAHIVADSTPVPTGVELCSAEVNARMRPLIGPADAGCEVVMVDGVPIRVSTKQDPEAGEVKIAVRFLTGCYVWVISQQGVPRYVPDDNLPADASRKLPAGFEHKPALAAPPLTTQQVAALAGNPAMLP